MSTRSVLFVAGAAHSGSTLLGFLVGAHPSVFYCGEAAKTRYLGDETKPARKRACKRCGENCPVWSRVTPDEPVSIYAQLAALTDRPHVMDSTKDPGWIAERAAELDAAGTPRRLIFLQRDGRAVVNSRRRKYPDAPFAEHVDGWVEQIARTRALVASFPGPHLAVRYERLATDPAATLRRIDDWMGLDFRPQQLRFWEHDYHPLGGNNGTQYLAWQREQATAAPGPRFPPSKRHNGYYRRHPLGIRLDLRWQRELGAADLERFEARAGTVNADFAWD